MGELGFDQAAGEGLMRLGASTDERHEEIGRVDGARACLAPWPRSPLSRATGKAGSAGLGRTAATRGLVQQEVLVFPFIQ